MVPLGVLLYLGMFVVSYPPNLVDYSSIAFNGLVICLYIAFLHFATGKTATAISRLTYPAAQWPGQVKLPVIK